MPSSQVLVLSFAVRFLSLLPASLPQPFHRCLPSALTSGPFHFRLPFFRPFLFRFQLLSFLLLPFLSLPVSPSQRVFFGAAPPPFSFLAPPLPFHPVSRASLPLLRTRLSVCFLSSFPASLPQLFHRCFPFALAFGLLPHFHFLSSASARLSTTQPLFLPFLSLPASASQWLPRCALSAFASLAFPVLSDLVSHVFLPGSSYSAPCSSFPPRCLAPQWLPQRLVLPLSVPGRFPLAFALGSGYSALVRSFSHELLHIITCVFICQQLFY